MKTSTVCVIIAIAALVVIIALALKGDVKASFRMLGTDFSIETTQRK